jgi:hypothetical protein
VRCRQPRLEEQAARRRRPFLGHCGALATHGGAGEGIDFPLSRGLYDTDPDGTTMLGILLDDVVDRYVEFAGDYYDIVVNRASVEHIMEHRPLTDAVVRTLNSSVTLAELSDDLTAIGYPASAG